MNAYLPPRVVDRFRESKIVYVSSDNVYEFTPVSGAGSSEHAAIGPLGEYAQSRLRGERLAQYTAHRTGTELFIARLFYATELRYGIIHDISWKVKHREPIRLETGHVNQIWQGDANAYLARSFELCHNPAAILNVTGKPVLSVREIAIQIGKILGEEPVFAGTESQTALLGDASELFERLGPPRTPVEYIIRRMAHWIQIGGHSLQQPTKYESRTGAF